MSHKREEEVFDEAGTSYNVVLDQGGSVAEGILGSNARIWFIENVFGFYHTSEDCEERFKHLKNSP